MNLDAYTTDRLPESIDLVFYRKLHELLADAGLDRRVADLCVPYYSPRQNTRSAAPSEHVERAFAHAFETGGACYMNNGRQRRMRVPIPLQDR